MQWNLSSHEKQGELVEDLAKTLPRWVGWLPVVGKAGYQRWQRRQEERSPSRNVLIELLVSRLDISQLDEGSLQLHFNVINFGNKSIELDRMKLYRIGVGSRNLLRSSDMIRMTGTIDARKVLRVHVDLDLYNSDIRSVVKGLTASQNRWSTPNTSVDLYADVLCICGAERFRKSLQTNTSQVTVQVTSAVADAFADSAGKTAR